MSQKLLKKERKRLLSRISHASGVAQYALDKKMTDEQVVEASKNLDVFLLIKDANNFNRHCQAEQTAAANAKLREFLNIDNSEIFKAGQWLLNSLSKTGSERKKSLLEKELVHKEDYNQDTSNLKDVIIEAKNTSNVIAEQSTKNIALLQNRIDELLRHNEYLKEYIKTQNGIQAWNEINKYLQ